MLAKKRDRMKQRHYWFLIICIAVVSGLLFFMKAADTKEIEIDNSNQIKNAQTALRDKGYDCGAIDGRLGNPYNSRTRTAIKKFQKDNQLSETGELTEETYQLIISKAPVSQPITDNRQLEKQIDMLQASLNRSNSEKRGLREQLEQKEEENKRLQQQLEKYIQDNLSQKIRKLKLIIWSLSIVILLLFVLGAFWLKQKSDRLKIVTIENEAHRQIIDTSLNQKGQLPTLQSAMSIWPPQNMRSWFIVGESVIGNSHVKSKLPCQDSYYIGQIDQQWGIAVTSDGAGTAEKSNIGSKYVANEVIPQVFQKIIRDQKWNLINKLPSEKEWKAQAELGMKQVKVSLEQFAQKEGLNIHSLACTVIVVLYSPLGLLVTHIGDGRAAYRTYDGMWKPMLKPWKGDEANATVFLTSNIWNGNLHNFMESRIINERPTAFALMSDGCEKSAFECSVLHPSTQQWSDPNTPYPKFFEPLVETLVESYYDKTSIKEVQANWHKFLESGNKALKTESDDKTMVLGIIV